MSDEVEQPDELTSQGTSIEVLQEQDASIWALLGVLLSTRTLPHVILVLLLSSILHVMASNGFESLSAIGFISLSSGYFVTGMLSSNSAVQRWTTLPDAAEDQTSGRFKSMASSFRICIFPLVVSLCALVALQLLVGENGALGDVSSTLPLILSSLFVVWAIVQGRSFATWLSTFAARRLPAAEETHGSVRISASVTLVMLVTLSYALLFAFEFITGGASTPVKVLSENVVFYALFAALFTASFYLTRNQRTIAAHQRHLHRFSSRWMLLTQAMITWHLLTVWRHWTMTPSSAALLIEELLLMMFTIIMAIWSLTSRSFRSSFRLVHTKNALPIGLAFGYAYAGSVAMLTTVLEDIRNVMMAGHVIVLLTFMWLQPNVLTQIIGNHDQSVKVQRIVAKITPASQEGEPNEVQDTIATEDADIADTSEASSTPNDIGDEVSWSDKAPETLAEGVQWDDEIELLD
ncbi:MAG: hypothetical protein L7U25_00840 [Candidatus Poseidonia sp.]|nr:hypothetical protein [Poseidonia sp.]